MAASLLLARAVRGLDLVSGAIGALAGALALALVLLVASNVLLRYLFRVGSVWSQELEWHLMVPLVLFSVVYAMQQQAHVRVDILFERFPLRLKQLIDLLAAVVTIAVAALVIRYAWPYVLQSWRMLEGSPDPGGIPARYLLKGLIPLGFALLILQGVSDLLANLLKLSQPLPSDQP